MRQPLQTQTHVSTACPKTSSCTHGVSEVSAAGVLWTRAGQLILVDGGQQVLQAAVGVAGQFGHVSQALPAAGRGPGRAGAQQHRSCVAASPELLALPTSTM